MPLVSVDYEYNLPNEFLVDHTFTDGKKRETTYDGPDKIYLIIDKETGVEKMGPVTAEEKADGRPVPLDCQYWEFDCVENPLFCQLRAPVIDEVEEEHTDSYFHPQSPEIPGYPRYVIQTPILPRNIYNKYKTRVNLETGELVLPVFEVNESMFGDHMVGKEVTWDYVRKQRDYELKKSDGRWTTDMPESLQNQWKEYRQLLRDLPTVLEEAGVPPNVALKMFPAEPLSEAPPHDPNA